MATNQTSYVTKLLYWQGPLSFEYTSIFKELIPQCKVFFDVGANSGYYSLVAASLNDKIKVHAFEPAQGPLHYLTKNVTLNDLSEQVLIHSEALSSESGQVPFYEVKNRKYSYLKYNLGGIGSLQKDFSKKAYNVRTQTLDCFVSENLISNIDLIKLDTEGTENLILDGAKETIQKYLPIIICETLFNRIEDKLEIIMKDHNYLFFNYEKGKLKQVDTLIRSADNGVRDCFFVHPSRVSLIKEFIAY